QIFQQYKGLIMQQRDSMSNPHDILLVGHYDHDTIVTPDGKKYQRQGGPVSHMTPFLKAANVDFNVVSKIGKDFLYTSNLHNPVDVSDKPTTAWLGDYTKQEREMKFLSICDPIALDDISTSAKVMIACGVANEILPGTIEKMRKNSEVLLCDMQAFCRRAKEDGTIYHIDPMKTWFKDYAGHFDFIKMSSSEAKFIDVDAMRKKTNVIVTKGENGCVIFMKDGRQIGMPAFKREEIDPTGAGDAFLAGFAIGLLKKIPIEECARIANYFGAIAVMHIGVPVVTKDDLKELGL
ncbi:MAG: PfkB family carbohydrate kinase, partial [Candidatus Aenigmarchaeota archaeon]|nr:PfkB family carbohydrate kinase [Candidatus Aenigmarchaeota archaeon]